MLEPRAPMNPPITPPLPQTPIDLGDNLRLRFAVPNDFDAWVDFNERMREYDPSSNRVGVWAHELMSGRHPTTRAGDFTVVEDTATGKIVSSLCLIPQTWSYGGIPFGCGRIEQVGTDPLYRRRGLIRKQMDVIHALSESKGELMQAITGIPWYYRQFGYEFALDLYYGRVVRVSPPSARTIVEFRVRPLTDADHAFVRSVYAHAEQRQPFSVVRSDEHWEWEFSGRTTDSEVYREWLVIEDTAHRPVGFIHYHPLPSSAEPKPWRLVVRQCALAPGVSYLNVMPDLLTALPAYVQSLSNSGGGKAESQPGEIVFHLGRDNPAYATFPNLVTSSLQGYAWYLRVPDLAAFLRHVRPALEMHLLGTPAEGYTGTLTLDFFHSGLRLEFNQGQVSAVTALNHTEVSSSDASFPDLTFLQLLGGRRTYAQLRESYPDCSATPTAQALLTALFPPFSGNLWHSD